MVLQTLGDSRVPTVVVGDSCVSWHALEFWLHSLPYMVLETMGDSCGPPFGVTVVWLVVLCCLDSLRLIAGPSSFPDVTGGVSLGT